jgi:hypothetical protein
MTQGKSEETVLPGHLNKRKISHLYNLEIVLRSDALRRDLHYTLNTRRVNISNRRRFSVTILWKERKDVTGQPL